MEEKNTAGARQNQPKTEGNSQKKKPSASKLRTLEMLYQPIFDIHLNMAIDFEVTVRINDRQMGVLLSEAIIPVAEKSNQICELNKWSIEEACDAILRCEKREVDINRIVIPISVKFLAKKNFVSQVAKIIEKKGVNHDKFCFNINESILEDEKAQVIESIKAIREFGSYVSIDDFGVEFTSLSHLGQYEVDYIGLDSSLTDEIMTSERTQNMVQGIIDFAKKIETQVRINGVDTEEKAKLLRSMGVDQMKGELYGKPMFEKQIKI